MTQKKKHPIVYSWLTESYGLTDHRKVRFTCDLDAVTVDFSSRQVCGRVAYSMQSSSEPPRLYASCHSPSHDRDVFFDTYIGDVPYGSPAPVINWLCRTKG